MSDDTQFIIDRSHALMAVVVEENFFRDGRPLFLDDLECGRDGDVDGDTPAEMIPFQELTSNAA